METTNPVHRRRPRYKGTHPTKFSEKYKELNPEKYAGTAEHVIEKGGTPAGMHIPICVKEILDFFQIQPGQVGLDTTLGYGGHTLEMLKCLKGQGHIYGLDVDPIESAKTRDRLARQGYGPEILTVIHTNFANLDQVAREHGPFQFILADLGVSSMQIDNPERGFSYHADAPLDMRMSQQGVSARDLVNGLSEQELADVIFRYGEDRNARRIARGIVEAREQQPLETTGQLAEVIKASVPAKVRRSEGHPARKTFQALRIAVNGELDRLQEGLEAAFSLLKPQGRLAVITFHSLEDRIVKTGLAAFAKGCTCPPDFPVCVCGKTPDVKLISRKPILPTAEEIAENPRARSAKLRAAEKLKPPARRA